MEGELFRGDTYVGYTKLEDMPALFWGHPEEYVANIEDKYEATWDSELEVTLRPLPNLRRGCCIR